MNWEVALQRNIGALLGFVSWMLAGLGSGSAGPLSRDRHLAILRILRPAESILRRLIVVAARGIRVTIGPRRTMPTGIVFAGGVLERAAAFPLFDPRKNFDRSRKAKTDAPRITVFGGNEPVPRREGPEPAEPRLNLDRLRRRLSALQNAVGDVPGQARRLARLRARLALRRAAGGKVRALGPLRPGSPPGYRKDRQEPVHDLLRECDTLARRAENEGVAR